MRINHNISALNTYRQLSTNNASGAKSLEKLSSGLRINRAGDDAAGLAISEKMRGQIRGLDQASRNAQDGISLIQTAEGALNETHSMLQRMRELVVQANNGTNSAEDIAAIQQEISQLSNEITATANKTQFNGKTLLDGSLGVKFAAGTLDAAELAAAGISLDVTGADAGETFTITFTANAAGTADTMTLTGTNSGIAQTLSLGDDGAATAGATAGTTLDFSALGVKITFNSAIASLATAIGGAPINNETFATIGTQTTFQIGANDGQVLSISFHDMQATALGTGGATGYVSDVDVTSTTQTFTERLGIIDAAIKQVSNERAMMGAAQNRLEHTINNLGTTSENLSAAESRIRDVDMAKEMMEYTKNNILSQAATAMLAQANQAPQGVLQLLR